MGARPITSWAANYYSAEVVAQSGRQPRRIRVHNRLTGDHYYRPFPGLPNLYTAEQVINAVMDFHTSPLFNPPEVLWWDDKLQMLFFHLTLKDT